MGHLYGARSHATSDPEPAHDVISLRDYQKAGIQGLREKLAQGIRRVALVAPTGAGKTTIAGAMIEGTVRKGNRCLFLAHRKELIEQCSARLDQFGIQHGIIQANHPKTDPTRRVQVASISTLIKRDHWDAEVIIVDECHRSTSKTYKKIIERYKSPVVIGLTATPYRMDGKGLGEVYDDLHHIISTQELIDMGYLVMPVIFGSKIKLDLSDVRVTGGDYNRGDLAAAMKETVLRGDLVENWASRIMEYTGVERVSDCRAVTVVFAPSVEQSIKIVEQFKAAGVPAAHIDAKTPTKEREESLRQLRAREISVVSNVGILCLDSETEILTSGGWAGIDTLSPEHDVANWWPDRRITWAKPIDIIKRRRDVNERMVSVSGRYANIRVTEGHRMLSKKSSARLGYTEFKTSKASDLVGERFWFPVSGAAAPHEVTIDQEFDVTEKVKRRRISARSHHLRANKGYSYEGSVGEASRRFEKKYSLRTKLPHELTPDDCWFIGFWIGDGSRDKLLKGGVEYKLTQSHRYSTIIKKIESTIASMGVDSITRTLVPTQHSTTPYNVYSFPRGTGSGCQERSGLYPIERYLNKDFAEDLWGLDREQLWNLLNGFWCADGNHGDSIDPGGSVRISNTNYSMLSNLQALAVSRGMHASLGGPKSNGPLATKPIYFLNVNGDKAEQQLGRDRLEFEPEWKDEMVWCCNVESTFIITRRHGRVTVMGNCEGWDLPHLECVVLARPTRSRSMFKQMVGRLMRPDDGKRFAFVLDHANCTQTHGFVNEAEAFTLEGREQRPRKGSAMAPHKICKKCDAMLGMRLRACPVCGAVQFQVDVRFTDEQLVELRPGEFERVEPKPVEERQNAFNDLCNQCMAREYKPNWARMRYQALYREWPAWNSGIRVTRSFREYERAWNAAEVKGQIGLLQAPK